MANSTYSWWAHYLALCRRTFANWVALSGWLNRKPLPFEAVVMPYSFLARDKSAWANGLSFVASQRYLFPDPRPLFAPIIKS